MIPKNLFFIWFGDNPPKYCEFAINAFKEVNPDFKVEWIRKSSNEIDNFENSNDELLKISCIKVIKSNNIINKKRLNFYCYVSDIYRRLLIKKYGGIYLDCDTFPVRPFDREILKCMTSYVCTAFFPNNNYLFHSDIFHIGSVKCNILKKIPVRMLYPPHKAYRDKNKMPIDYKILHEKFYNCSLKYGEIKDDMKYIEHFYNGSFLKKNRIEKSNRFDK